MPLFWRIIFRYNIGYLRKISYPVFTHRPTRLMRARIIIGKKQIYISKRRQTVTRFWGRQDGGANCPTNANRRNDCGRAGGLLPLPGVCAPPGPPVSCPLPPPSAVAVASSTTLSASSCPLPPSSGPRSPPSPQPPPRRGAQQLRSSGVGAGGAGAGGGEG